MLTVLSLVVIKLLIFWSVFVVMYSINVVVFVPLILDGHDCFLSDVLCFTSTSILNYILCLHHCLNGSGCWFLVRLHICINTIFHKPLGRISPNFDCRCIEVKRKKWSEIWSKVHWHLWGCPHYNIKWCSFELLWCVAGSSAVLGKMRSKD